MVAPVFAIVSQGHLSEHISKLTLKTNNGGPSCEFVVFGVWLQYDDKSREAIDWHSLSLVTESIKKCRREGLPFILTGDWNCDIGRRNCFDDMFRAFIENHYMLILCSNIL